MAFQNAGGILRGDLTTVLMQGVDVEKLTIGTKVFPIYGVPIQQGQFPFFQIGGGQTLTALTADRNPDGSYKEIQREYTPKTYNCQDRGLEERVDDVYRENISRFFSAEVIAAKLTYTNVLLAHETRVATALYNTSNFTATSAIVSYTASATANVDFVRDVQNAIQRMTAQGTLPNSIVMSDTLANYVKRTTLFQNFVKPYNAGYTGAIPTDSIIAAAFKDLGIDDLYIARANANQAQDATSVSMSPIWSNTYFWVGKVEGGDPYAGGAGRTFVFDKDGGAFVTESYRNEMRRSDMVRVRMNSDENVIDPACGQLVITGYTA